LTCVVCHEGTEPKQAIYCTLHQRALENIKQAFVVWETAYGTLSVPDFLKRVLKTPSAGEKVKEIARFVLENPSRWH
jgi:hypothetical protein